MNRDGASKTRGGAAPPGVERPWRRRLGLALKLTVTLGLSAWIISLVDWREFANIVGRSSPWIIVLVTALRFGGVVLSSIKWRQLLVVHGVRYRLARLLRWYLVGSFLNHFLPGSIGGDGYRIYKTWDNQRSRGVAVLAVALERITGMSALAALGYSAAVILYLGTGGSVAASVAGAGSLCLVAGILAIALSSRLQVVRRLRGSRYGKYLEGAGALAADFRVQPRRTALVVGLSFAFHLNKLVAVWLLLHTLGATVNPLELMTALFVVELAGLLPVSLGGLGIVEGSFMLVMGQFGVAGEVALATMLLLRVLMLPFYLAGAAFYILGDRTSGHEPSRADLAGGDAAAGGPR